MENKSNAKRNGHGGKREGAGRKSIGDKKKVTVTFTIDGSAKEKLMRLSETQGVSMSECINQMLLTL